MCCAVFYFIYDTYAMYVVYQEGQQVKKTLAAVRVKSDIAHGKGDITQVKSDIAHKSSDIAQDKSHVTHAKSDSNGNVDNMSTKTFLSSFINFVRARPLMVAHHMVLPVILFPIFMTYETGLGDCLMAIGFLMEASTPLVSLRKILSVVGKNISFNRYSRYLNTRPVMFSGHDLNTRH